MKTVVKCPTCGKPAKQKVNSAWYSCSNPSCNMVTFPVQLKSVKESQISTNKKELTNVE